MIFLFRSWFPFKITLLDVLVPMLGIIVFLILSEVIKEKKLTNFLVFCGKNSLIFYLMEGFILVIVRSILIKIIPIEHNKLFVSLYFILKILLASIITKYFINKSKILSCLLGNKI